MKSPTKQDIESAQSFWDKLGEACQARGAEMVRKWEDMPEENRDSVAMALREWLSDFQEWEKIGSAL